MKSFTKSFTINVIFVITHFDALKMDNNLLSECSDSNDETLKNIYLSEIDSCDNSDSNNENEIEISMEYINKAVEYIVSFYDKSISISEDNPFIFKRLEAVKMFCWSRGCVLHKISDTNLDELTKIEFYLSPLSQTEVDDILQMNLKEFVFTDMSEIRSQVSEK